MAQTCVHQSCGKKFMDPDEPCIYHPGPPIFHEGQKGWKCCKPRVLTFDEFLSIPPCTTGKHSTTDKPPVIEKNQPDPMSAATLTINPSRESLASSRAPVAAPQPTATPPPPAPESEDDDLSLDIPDGAVCRRRACGRRYKAGSDRKNENCVYHPGAPLFHEGSKGYTCCKRRVLEFDEFMKIEGCMKKDRHLFIGSGKRKKGGETDATGDELVETVRSDFYQTATTVIASFFLKKIDKDAASVVFQSETEISLNLPTTDVPPKRYRNIVELFGPINPEESTFKILGTKLELTLVKADGSSWPVLRKEDPRTGEIIQTGKAGRAV